MKLARRIPVLAIILVSFVALCAADPTTRQIRSNLGLEIATDSVKHVRPRNSHLFMLTKDPR